MMKIRHEVEMVSLAALRRNVASKSDGFLKSVFTRSEQRYCRSNRMLLEHYGARLAAKRAVLKVLGLNARNRKFLRAVEIGKYTNGQPYVQLAPRLCRQAKLPHGLRIEITLAHERKFAVAAAMAVLP